MLNKKERVRGFTLIELLVVIAIIGILSGVIIVSLSGAQNSAKDSCIKKDMDQLRSAAHIQNLIAGSYADFQTLSDDVILILDDIDDNGGEAVISKNGSSFCVTSILNSNDDLWCIDSSGYVGIGGCLSYSCDYASGVGTGGGSGGGTPWACGDSITDARDGTTNTYTTVSIGDQCWIAENLKYLPSVVGPGTISTSDAYYYVYDYDGISTDDARISTNYPISGVLYNWTAAITACPTDWHLPTDGEWKNLETYLGMNEAQVDATGMRGTDEGAKLSSYAAGGTNSSGFSAILGGYLSGSGSWYGITTDMLFLTATESSTEAAYFRNLDIWNGGVYRGTYNKGGAFSLRCVKD